MKTQTAFRFPLIRLLVLFVCVAGAAADLAFLRGDHREKVLRVLSRIDDVLDKEIDVLTRETDTRTSSSDAFSNDASASEYPIAHGARFKNRLHQAGSVAMASLKGLAKKTGKWLKAHESKLKLLWLAMKVGAALAVVFCAPPVAAAFAAGLIVAKGIDSLVTIHQSREAWNQIADLQKKGELEKGMAAACKASVGAKFVATIFLTWATLVVPFIEPIADAGAMDSGSALGTLQTDAREAAAGYKEALIAAGSEMVAASEGQALDLAHEKFLQFKCSSPDDPSDDPEASVLHNVQVPEWEEWEFGCPEDDDGECIDMADVYNTDEISDRVDSAPMTENPMLAKRSTQA